MWILIAVLVLFVAVVVWLLSRPDEVQPIDNTDGHIICGITNKPCIKDTLYTYWDNCSGCPIYTHIE